MDDENHVDGYREFNKRCFLGKQLKPKTFGVFVNKKFAVVMILFHFSPNPGICFETPYFTFGTGLSIVSASANPEIHDSVHYEIDKQFLPVADLIIVFPISKKTEVLIGLGNRKTNYHADGNYNLHVHLDTGLLDTTFILPHDFTFDLEANYISGSIVVNYYLGNEHKYFITVGYHPLFVDQASDRSTLTMYDKVYGSGGVLEDVERTVSWESEVKSQMNKTIHQMVLGLGYPVDVFGVNLGFSCNYVHTFTPMFEDDHPMFDKHREIKLGLTIGRLF